MYEYTDKVLAYLKKRFIRAYRRLKTRLNFDELNTLEAVDECYDGNYTEVRRKYLEIAKHAYYSAGGKSDSVITYIWLDKILNSYDPATKYVFNHEVERKKARAFESIEASPTKKEKYKQADIALRYWWGQSKQYADEVTDKATIKAYKDMGITAVRWNTENDTRVCAECARRHGKVFLIDRIPPKPHIGCRCWFTPVRTEK